MARPPRRRSKAAARVPALPAMLAVLLAVALSAGCTSAVTQLQRGRVLERGRFEVNGGTSVPISGRAARALIAAEDNLSERLKQSQQGGSDALTREDVRQLTELAAAVMLFTPLPNAELSVRGGIGWDVDVGLRRSGPRTQLDLKWQALHAEQHGVDLGLSLAGAHHSSPASSVWDKAMSAADFLQVMDYRRKDLTLSLIASRDISDVFSFWFALAYSRSWIAIDSKLLNLTTSLDISQADLTIDETMDQYGGQIGFRVGYRYVFLLVEFSAMQVDFRPLILGERADLSGLIFTPSLALQVTF